MTSSQKRRKYGSKARGGRRGRPQGAENMGPKRAKGGGGGRPQGAVTGDVTCSLSVNFEYRTALSTCSDLDVPPALSTLFPLFCKPQRTLLTFDGCVVPSATLACTPTHIFFSFYLLSRWRSTKASHVMRAASSTPRTGAKEHLFASHKARLDGKSIATLHLRADGHGEHFSIDSISILEAI